MVCTSRKVDFRGNVVSTRNSIHGKRTHMIFESMQVNIQGKFNLTASLIARQFKFKAMFHSMQGRNHGFQGKCKESCFHGKLIQGGRSHCILEQGTIRFGARIFGNRGNLCAGNFRVSVANKVKYVTGKKSLLCLNLDR